MDRSDAILVVEDNADDIELIRYAFRRAGVTNPISFVDDGEKAVSYLSGRPPFDDRGRHPLPSLILLDLKLPRLSGFEVLEWIRANEETRLTPVVVLTSSNQRDDIQRVYELCGNSYLVKPVKRSALQDIIESLDQYWLKLNRTASA